MTRSLLLVLLATCITLSFHPAQAQKSQAPASIPVDQGVKIGKLPNGLTYYIRKNVEPKNRAELYMVLKAGSLMETDAQRGLAHFTEHMAFNGTRDFPKNELINYLQKAGVKFGADLNAYTSFGETVYQLPIPTDSAALFHNGFKILANWAGYVQMEGTEIDAERGIIVEEERQRGKNAQSRISEQMLPVILKGSRYADRLPIGKTEIVQNFDHKEIKSFYTDWYRPNLQAVIAVGDFDVAEVEKLIKENFSPLKNPANPRPVVAYDLPAHKEPMVKIVTDEEYPYNVAFLTIRHKGGGATKTEADVRRNFINSMINSMMGTRLTELAQSGKAPFVQGQFGYGAYQGGIVPNQDAASIVAVSKSPEELATALEGVTKEAERMAKFGFTASELKVVKKNFEAGNEKSYRERDKVPSKNYVQQYQSNFLYGSAIMSADYRYNLNKKLLENITLEEVNRAAAAIMKPENMIVLVQAPQKEKAKLPTEAQLLAAVKNASNNLTPYVDNAVDKPLLEKMPTPGKVTKEEKNDALGLTTLTLSNGVKVVLKPTDFRNDQILFSSYGEGGTSLAEDADVIPVSYAANIPDDGIGEFDVTQLRKVLAGSTAGAGAYISELYQGYSGSASPKDLETALQLVYAYATNPRKDPVVFKKNTDDMRVVLGGAGVTPESVYGDTINAVMSGNSVRDKTLTVADVDKINLDKSFEFYKARFADNSNQVFVFVGNFDVNEIKPLLEKYLGGLPVTGKPEKYIDRGSRPLKGEVTRIVRKGIEDKATVRLTFHGDYDYNSENNTQLQALGEILEFKVLERLREKESGVYSPNVGVSSQKLPISYFTLTISFSCASANVDKLIAAALDEVDKIKKEGGTAVDVEKFKAEQQRSLEVGLRQNNFWLGYLSSKIRQNEDLLDVQKQNEYLKKVTTESVKQTAKQLLDNANFFKAILVPEKQ